MEDFLDVLHESKFCRIIPLQQAFNIKQLLPINFNFIYGISLVEFIGYKIHWLKPNLL